VKITPWSLVILQNLYTLIAHKAPVKDDPVIILLLQVKASRPRPELWGRGQDYEVEAEAKIIMKKVPNND